MTAARRKRAGGLFCAQGQRRGALGSLRHLGYRRSRYPGAPIRAKRRLNRHRRPGAASEGVVNPPRAAGFENHRPDRESPAARPLEKLGGEFLAAIEIYGRGI